MGGYKAPCIYINDKTTIGKTVVEVPTAIPVFIGCKEKAGSGNDDPKGIPWKISSMTEFMQYCGGMPKMNFKVDIKEYHRAMVLVAGS